MLGGFAGPFGLSEELALRIACAYGSGIAGTGSTCGAVSGALLALGLACGRARVADQAAKLRTYHLARELERRFAARHGTTVCNALLGVDVSTEDGARRAREEGLFRSRCPGFVRTAAELVAELA